MDGSLWMESRLKADGPKCVVLAFLCCPDAYYCPILDSQFSLFFLFFGLWFDWIYVVSCVLAESEGGVLIFECNQEYTNDPQWFSVLCLEKGQYNTPWSISFQGKTKFSMASCIYIIRVTLNTEFNTLYLSPVNFQSVDQSLQMISRKKQGVHLLQRNGVALLSNASR